jgi:hypothetical protein
VPLGYVEIAQFNGNPRGLQVRRESALGSLNPEPERASRIVSPTETRIKTRGCYREAPITPERRIGHYRLEVAQGGRIASGVREEPRGGEVKAHSGGIDLERSLRRLNGVVGPAEPEGELEFHLERRYWGAPPRRGVEIIQGALVVAEDIPQPSGEQERARIERDGPVDLRAGVSPPPSQNAIHRAEKGGSGFRVQSNGAPRRSPIA